MFANQTTILNFHCRVILVTLISIFCYLVPTTAQDSTNTETPTDPEPATEQPVTTNPAEETNNNTTTTPPPSSTTTTPTSTTTTPVVSNPSSTTTTNTTSNSNRPATPTNNNTSSTTTRPTDYNPFELVKNGRSFEKDLAAMGEEVVTPTPRRNTNEETDVEEDEPTDENEDENEGKAPEETPMEQSAQPQKVEVDPNNPFELVKNGNIAVYSSSDDVSKKSGSSKKSSSKKKPKKERKPIIDGSKLNYEAIVKFLGLLIIIGFLSFLTTSFRGDLQKIYRAFSNSNMMTQLQREKGSLLNMPYIPLYILYALTGGTFIYLAADYFNVPMLENKGLSLLACIVGLGGFYLFKHLLLKVISVIFPFKKEINQYHFLVGIFNQIIGLALIPMVMLIAFAPQNIKLFAIYGALAIVGVIFLNRLLRSFVIISKFIAFHKFHLIVYICAVEIAPFFIIIKFLMG